MTLAFPQDNVILPTGKLSQAWQRFFQNLASQVGDKKDIVISGQMGPSSGAFTSATATARYQIINGWAYWQARVDITNNGTGAGTIGINLPVSTFARVVGSGTNLTTGKMIQVTQYTGLIPSGSPNRAVTVSYYDGTYPVGASGILQLQAIYEVLS